MKNSQQNKINERKMPSNDNKYIDRWSAQLDDDAKDSSSGNAIKSHKCLGIEEKFFFVDFICLFVFALALAL